MKKVEYADLAKIGATKEQLNTYSSTDPLEIYLDDDGTYTIAGIVEARFITAPALLALLDGLGDCDD